MGCLNVECKFDFISNLGPDILRILMLWYAVNVTDFACKLFIFGGFYTMRGWLLGQNIWSRYLELIMVHNIKLQKTFTYNFKCVAYCAGFELWCWRLLRVPWIARKSNQSVLKEISPECSLEGQILKLKLQYFGHLMQRTDSLEKTWCWERLKSGEGDARGQDGWMASWSRWTWVWVSSGRWWSTGKPGMLPSLAWQRVRYDWATERCQWISWLRNRAHIPCSSYTGLWFLYHWTIKTPEHQRFDDFLKCKIQKLRSWYLDPSLHGK